MSVAEFVAEAGWDGAVRVPLAGDASARRYWRLTRADGNRAICMADPDPRSLAAFVRVAAHLEILPVSPPRIFALAQDQGLMLLEDFGDTTVSHLLGCNAETARIAYGVAAKVPAVLEQGGLPSFAVVPDAPELAGMVNLTLDLLPDPLPDLLPALGDALTRHAGGAVVLSLRDFHADNLMWLPDRSSVARVGLLDFQDAVALPRGYDLASLLDDPRRVVPEDWRAALIEEFARGDGVDTAEAHARIDTLSLQRNLRILGIFRRLSTTSAKPRYAAFLPRTVALIKRAVANPSLADLRGPVATVLGVARGWIR